MNILFLNKENQKGMILFFTFLIFLFYFTAISLSLNKTPIVTRGEGREAQVVLAMERTNNYILPLRNDTIVPSKPPLFHWISVAISSLTDQISGFSLRAPSAISGAIILASYFFFIIKFSNPVIAILTTCIIATSFEFMRYSTQSRVDMVFAASLTISLILLYCLAETKRFFLKEFLCVAFLALAILAKGPFGAIIPAIIIFSYIFLNKDKNKKIIFRFLLYFIIATIIASSWYILAYQQMGDEFIKMQILRENLSRALKIGPQTLGHKKPFYYSIIYLFMIMLPWTIFLPRLLYTLRLNLIREQIRTNSLLRFNITWIFVFIFAVAISSSKRSVYFLPAIPAISYLFAYVFSSNLQQNIPNVILKTETIILKTIKFIFFLGFITGIIMTGLILFDPNIYEKSAYIFVKNILVHNIIKELFFTPITVFTLCLLWLVSLKINIQDRFEHLIIKLSALFFTLFIFIQYQIIPLILINNSPIAFSTEVNQILDKSSPEINIYQYDDEYYAPVYYLTRTAPIKFKKDLLEMQNQSFYLLIKNSKLEDFRKLNILFSVSLKNKPNLENDRNRLILLKIN